MENNNPEMKKDLRSRLAAPIGLVVIIFAIIGLISTTVFAVNKIKASIDKTEQKAEFEQFIYPVVMFDPVPFDSIGKADMIMLIQSSLWDTLINGNREKYQYDDQGLMIVPATDVNMSAAKLFGRDAKLEHQTFGDVTAMFIYDEEIRSYRVPVSAIIVQYEPKVTQIVRSGDLYALSVTYVPPASIFDVGDAGAHSVVKEMVYTLKKVDKEYCIVSIDYKEGDEVLPPVEIPSAPATPPDSSQESDVSSGEESDASSSDESSTTADDKK